MLTNKIFLKIQWFPSEIFVIRKNQNLKISTSLKIRQIHVEEVKGFLVIYTDMVLHHMLHEYDVLSSCNLHLHPQYYSNQQLLK